jgi:hypothetical protein
MSKQYHFVIGYDDTSMKWFVESDTTAYFADGNIWDQKKSDSSEWGYMGWSFAEDNSHEEALDAKCLNMLVSLVPIWPSPVVNGEL